MKKQLTTYNLQLTNLRKRDGITSLLVTIGLALLFTVMITGITVLSVQQSRQALDVDLSNRARLGAEAAARDAAQRLVRDPNEEYPNCDPADPLTHPVLDATISNQVSIACRTVTRTTSNPIEAPVAQDDGFQVNAFRPAGTAPTKLDLRWGKDLGGSFDYGTPFYRSSTNFGNHAAAMEITVIFWPRIDANGTMGSNAALQTSFVLSGKGDQSFLQPAYHPGSTCAGVAGGYNCAITGQLDLSRMIQTATNNSTADAKDYNIVVRVQPRYKQTDIYMQFLNSSGSPVAVQSNSVIIDVTAKAGNLYRRIRATKPVGSSAAVDSVLYTGGKICKNLVVDLNHNPAPGGTGRNNCNGSE